MISAEAGHAEGAEAAEPALDAYLIKAHTAEALGQRLLEARKRKLAPKDVFALTSLRVSKRRRCAKRGSRPVA